MNIIRTIRSGLARFIAPREPGALERIKMLLAAEFTGGIPLTKLSDYASYLKEGTSKVWAHWQASNIVAQAVQEVPVRVRRRDREVNVPDLQQLLTVANPEMTFDELLYLLVMHLKFTGNAFIAKMRDGGTKPRALYPMNPKRVKIIPDNKGNVIGYTLDVGSGTLLPFDPDDVIHFRRFHPNNDFWGIGEMEAGESLIQGVINTADWSRNFWKNGAAPSGILVEKSDTGINEQDFEQAKRTFRKEYGGRDNSGKLAMMTGKWEHIKLGLTMEEMQSIESQRWSIEQIYMLHGIPLSIAGVKDAANYATANIDEVRFRKYVVRPTVRIFGTTLTSDLASEFGNDLKIEFALSTLENLESVMLGIAPAFDRGIISINEAREICGLKPDPDNEEWERRFISGNLIPLEMAGEPQADIASTIRADSIARRMVSDVPAKNGNGDAARLLHDAFRQ